MTLEETQLEVEKLKNEIAELKRNVDIIPGSKGVNLIDWNIKTLRLKRLDVIAKGNSLYGVRSDDGYYVGDTNVITSGRVLWNINSVAQTLIPNTDNTYYLGKNSSTSPFAWKGLIVKDTTNGNYYRIEVINGAVTATVL